MGCRVGITTDPAARRKYWEGQYPTLRDWRILRECSSKSEAQSWENYYAKDMRCDAHPGGSGPEYATWYVYYFKF